MTGDIGLVLLILGAAIILFASERIRVDVVSMMVLMTLLLTGLVTTREAFSGFSSPAVITVWAIYIVSASLTHTGVADLVGRYIWRVAGTGEARLVLVIMLTVGIMSAFMNNIGATAVLLPVVVGLGRRMNIPASKLLIPLAFGSLLGGVTTLIGTPPNLLVSNALQEANLEPFSLFDYTPMGLIIMLSSILYMVLVGRHLLPSNTETTHHGVADLTTEYRLRDYLAELHILPQSTIVGDTLISSQLGEKYDLTVMGLLREGRLRSGFMPNTHIQAGDILLVKGSSRNLLEAVTDTRMSINPEPVSGAATISSPEVGVEEIVISQRANFIGQTLKEINFRGRYGLTVLAIWREEAPIIGRPADVPLHLGDTLLVLGRRESFSAIREDDGLLLLQDRAAVRRRWHKAPINLVIFAGMILSVSLGWLHISVAAVAGSILMVLSDCLTMDEAYQSIQWKSVYLIAGMLPMGVAMDKSGTAQFLADQIVSAVGPLGPQAIMVGLFVLTTIITEFMSNAAAAVLVAPIAISAALGVGVDPRAFVMGVGIAASNSFLFPIGHQASVLVYGPGGYRFFDYTRVGLPLTLLIWTLMVVFLPVFWPL